MCYNEVLLRRLLIPFFMAAYSFLSSLNLLRGDEVMINLTVGPVTSYKEILDVAGRQVPYFRTEEFSKLMLENERMLLDILKAPDGSRCAFLTSSGTGGMEACVSGLLSVNDQVAIINGGTFGQRFVNLCELYSIPFVEVGCKYGEQITKSRLQELKDKGITALLVNMNETSSGVLYDMEMISEFCRSNSIFLIVDVISSFLADEVDMESMSANAVIIASQKALALQPGLSIVVMDSFAQERNSSIKTNNLYLNLSEALINMERGQTPFTPGVSILIQLNKRLKMIIEHGGVDVEIKKVKELSSYFREKMEKYPLELIIREPENRSNAVTAVGVRYENAEKICETLKNKYGIWVCPNGGLLKNKVFRVGHIGDISINDFRKLFNAFDEMYVDGIL